MEDYDYYASGYKYGSKDKPFEDFEELKLVSGVDETVFQILKNNLTLYPMSANKIVRLTSEATQPDTSKTYRIVVVVHLTGDNYKPYRFIKWSSGSGVI
jgi:type II secretory pathway component PulK